VESEKVDLIGVENRMVVTRGWESIGEVETLINGY
jgi:hypothetical protein